jgi:hypothetical protein
VKPTAPSGHWLKLRIPVYGVMAGEVHTESGRPLGGARIKSEPIAEGYVHPMGVRTSQDGRFVEQSVAGSGQI